MTPKKPGRPRKPPRPVSPDDIGALDGFFVRIDATGQSWFPLGKPADTSEQLTARYLIAMHLHEQDGPAIVAFERAIHQCVSRLSLDRFERARPSEYREMCRRAEAAWDRAEAERDTAQTPDADTLKQWWNLNPPAEPEGGGR